VPVIKAAAQGALMTTSPSSSGLMQVMQMLGLETAQLSKSCLILELHCA
jgi:hypothetical protein